MKRDFWEERKSGEVYCLGGLISPRNIFELSTLDFQQFQHGFYLFSDKKGLLLGEVRPFSGGPSQGLGWGEGASWGLWPLQYTC